MKVTSVLLIASVGLFAAAPVLAQSIGRARPERPSRALYGSTGSDTEPELSVSGVVGTGYDTDPTQAGQDANVLPDNSLTASASAYAMLGAELSFAREGDRLGLGASIASAGRYYPNLDQTFTMSHGGSVGVQLSFSERTRLDAAQSMTYQSARAFVPFAPLSDPELGQIAAPELDFTGSPLSYRFYGTTANFSHQLSRDTSLQMTYFWNRSGQAARSTNFTSQSGSFRLTQSLTRGLSVRLGYGLVDTSYGTEGENYRQHNIDSGLVFARDLSITRRTRLSFSSGATAMKERESMRYDVIGTANLTHEIGRTWSAMAAYNRNVGFSDALRTPYLSDNVSVGVNGQLSRRLGFQAGGGTSFGHSATAPEAVDAGFATWFGSSVLQMALTRKMAISANYTYFAQEIDRTIVLAPGFAPSLGRHSVSVTLNVFQPLVERRRRANAAR